MAQAMEKDRVIGLLEYYKDIDGEVNITPLALYSATVYQKEKIIYHDKQKIWRLIFQIMSAAKSESMKQRRSSYKR